MVKWEYKVVPIRTQIHSDYLEGESRPVIEDVQNDLNALGNEGWELVGVQDARLADGRMFTVAYLKRQVGASNPHIDLHKPALRELRKS